jgi:hypothetical protein
MPPACWGVIHSMLEGNMAEFENIVTKLTY